MMNQEENYEFIYLSPQIIKVNYIYKIQGIITTVIRANLQ